MAKKLNNNVSDILCNAAIIVDKEYTAGGC